MLNLVTQEEVKQTVMELPDDKAPGLDGYPTEFYKTFWASIGK